MVYTVERNKEALKALRAEKASNEPIGMLNLLRFREQAEYGNSLPGVSACSGREAYDRYSKRVIPLVLDTGGVPVWKAKGLFTLIAPEGETWDQVVLVAYPSRQAFLDLMASPKFAEARLHRLAALTDSRLIEVQLKIVPKTLQRILGWGMRFKLKTKPGSMSERPKGLLP